ncbi:glycosyl hydrolase-related protein [Jejuia spongiicola]|uniref:Glycosyl hydrolase-related protein n=1 Tax=Jejuia spongiicola TaxID=2942207 RepID=A0ABT0QHW2_9FLAO|nr:glycosyl hydrolase-related protein [Jejuia spongiicola]MCL6296581.1 glycosyl hydrolase-related protein [Jejuia spongiicola]
MSSISKNNLMMKYNICTIFFVLIMGFGFSQNSSNKATVSIEYEKPYKYEYIGTNILVKGTLDIDSKDSYEKVIFQDGRTFQIEVEGGKAKVWLPVIGEAGIIKFVGKKRDANKEQLFTPLVTSDWDYFKEGTFHIIASSHQDIAWMDTPEYCRHERINDIIAPALDIMKTDEHYYFGMEQALNLKEFIEDQPERKEEVIERYREGRFTWGATYNQPYEGMQTGEQLIREMYFGKLWIKNNFDGINEETAFNTDVPGRTLQFPQILAKSGVKNLFVSRMKEGFFDWHSPDGSSVLTYSPGNYGWAAMFYKLFDEDAIEAMHKIQNRVKIWSDYYRERKLSPHFAIVISNDASGPTDYGKLVKEWNTIISKTGAKIPTLRHSTVADFLSDVRNPNADFEDLEGDRPNIWAYIHGPGHHKAITASRKAGRLLPSAEIFGAVESILNNSFANYPQDDLSKAFEESIYPDHGWGGKNGHITDSIFKSKLEFAANEADRLVGKSLKGISKNIKTNKKNAIVVYNDLSWKRSGLASVTIANANKYHVVDNNGKMVPSQASASDKNKLHFYASDIPSIGYKTFYLKRGAANSSGVNKKIAPNMLSNAYYTMHLGNGGITYLYDHVLNKEVLNTTKFSGGDVMMLEYDGNGAGEFTQMTEPKMNGVFDPNGNSYNATYEITSANPSNWSVLVDGEVFTEYETRTKFKHAQVVQRIRVYHQDKKIDFFVDLLNWDGTHNREFRFALPINTKDAKIKYEVPLAIAEVGKTEMKEAPMGWAWGGTYDQKPDAIHPREVMNFISSENETFGVTLATDVALADWIDPTREAVDYSVLQGILLSSHKSCHGEGNWYHQTGDHHFKFSMTSHNPSESIPYQFGTASNHKLWTVLKQNLNTKGVLGENTGFFEVSDPMVRISTVKRSEDGKGIIVRLVEMEGKDKQVTIKLPEECKELIKVNLIEKEEKTIEAQTGTEISINIGMNAIDTYMLILKK